MNGQKSAGWNTAAEPIWLLLWRYFWPFRYFRDVTRGPPMVRIQNYRHNRAMRIYLPGFIVKWAGLTVLWFGFGGLFEKPLGLVIPAAGCFMTGTYTAVVAVILLASWIWLERFPELY